MLNINQSFLINSNTSLFNKKNKEKKLGQFFTTNVDYILKDFEKFIFNKDIAGPFCGNQDLLNLALKNNAKYIRIKFFDKFDIKYCKYFTQQVFDDTTYNVIAFYYKLKEKQNEKQDNLLNNKNIHFVAFLCGIYLNNLLKEADKIINKIDVLTNKYGKQAQDIYDALLKHKDNLRVNTGGFIELLKNLG